MNMRTQNVWLEEQLKHYDPDHRLIMVNGQNTGILVSFKVLVALLESEQHAGAEIVNSLLEGVLATQMLEPEYEHGRFPMSVPFPHWRDLNANLFIAPCLFDISIKYLDKLPDALRERFIKQTRLAFDYAERRWDDEVFDPHRDFKYYTNIFILYIQCLLLAGVLYDSERLLRNSRYQWQRWFNHISYYGIDEFNSTTYNRVVVEALLRIHELTPYEDVKREVAAALDHVITVQHAITHPVFKLPVVGISRDYRKFLESGGEGFPYLDKEGDCSSGGYQAPAHVFSEFRNRAFPFECEGRATYVPFTFKSWQDRQCGVGTMSGGHYFCQQLTYFAAAGISEDEREFVFVPFSNRNFCSAFSVQHEYETLSVWTRSPTTYTRCQLRVDDQEIPDELFADFSIGMSPGWQVVESLQAGCSFSAYDYKLLLRPFIVVNGDVRDVELELREKGVADQTFSELVFPDEADMFGLYSALLPCSECLSMVEISYTESGRKMLFNAGQDLTLKLYRHESGEIMELRENGDWRCTPLFAASSGFTLSPGMLLKNLQKTRRHS